ncbi:MFS transporter [Halodesulfovibrio marinisediminis]|uniref:Major Facilitator Superfamily protein n=1 Tax=Halodesulfovibrio marinisediminis DSM 17456 TaxID=1121457 RepID=A0A1N6F861_9BACT|nr:MFS transporter [Halodesulfovibrio marinisediminis]SIN91472.1 Major Facilitator Superfamily protein [Halodesulfovibrio marinisediminis DSM 17456]
MTTNKTVSPAAATFIVAAVQFLTPFMMSAVGVALPSIGKEFSAGAFQLGLVEMAYILAGGILMLPCGRFADIRGRKKVFLTGLVVFICATFFIALAPSMEALILLRFVQGAGSALVAANSIAIISSVVPPQVRGRAMGIVAASVYMGLSASPTLTGFIIQYGSWRWIFWGALPLQLAALWLTFTRLHGEWFGAKGAPFDWKGSLMYAAAICMAMTGITHLKAGGIFPILFVLGILGLCAFFFWEAKEEHPILNVPLLKKNRTFSLSSLVLLANYASSFGVTFFFSLYLQQIKGVSPQYTGLTLVIQPAIMAVLSPFVGALGDKVNPGKLTMFGLALCTVALSICSTVTASTSIVTLMSILVLLGFGFAFFSSPNLTVIMNCVEPKHYGVAASLSATMRTLGMLTAMVSISFILSLLMGSNSVSDAPEAFISSMQTGFSIFTVVSAIGVACSFASLRAQKHSAMYQAVPEGSDA